MSLSTALVNLAVLSFAMSSASWAVNPFRFSSVGGPNMRSRSVEFWNASPWMRVSVGASSGEAGRMIIVGGLDILGMGFGGFS